MTTATLKLVNIGNSQGVRIPKHYLEHATPNKDFITVTFRTVGVREGWAKAFARADQREAKAMSKYTPTKWDETEWQWDE